MVKVPIGKIVKVDLWDSIKRRGMVKYFTNTMDLVRAESEFNLNKGDSAIVVESHDSFVLVVPKDEYMDLLKGNSFNYKKFIFLVFNILKDRMDETGGILSFEELFSIFKRSSIQDRIKKKHLVKVTKINNDYFDLIKFDDSVFIVLKPATCLNDQNEILNFSRNKDYITIEMIHHSTSWSYLRISRILEYLKERGRCRKDTSFRTGDRYYFHNL